MKRQLLSIVALSAVFCASGAWAQNAPQGQMVGGAPAGKPQKMVKIATITGADAVREFQNNVQVLQAERQDAAQLSMAIEKEKDAQKKKKMQAELDAKIAKLNEDNATMTKAYGFSLARNYQMVIESAEIYMLVTDEEAAKLEERMRAEQQKNPKPAETKKAKK